MDIDFGYKPTDNSGDANVGNVDNNDSTNLETGNIDTGDSTNLNNSNINNNVNNDDTKEPNKLSEGTTIEVGDITYSVDKDGNLVDKDGNIFKQSSEVDAWMKEFDKVDDNTEIDINNIINAIGIDITDENDKPIEFENNIDGIKSYINAVIESAKEEHYETAINTLYQRYPILNDVLNYYIANNNSLDGFNEIRDLSSITIDEKNEAQQETIIKTAWNERGQKGDVNNYIAYLKSSGTLYATAKDELESLQESDRQYREQLEADAMQKENERIKQLEDYWNGVHDIINKREIAGYKIPDSIIINRNGQKLSVTPEDFFNYIYRTDKDGKSAYERDLMSETFESRRDDEILRAYLKFVGGNYSNLVNMAVNKEQVNKLKLKAKERSSSSIRINKPSTTAKKAELDLGYN